MVNTHLPVVRVRIGRLVRCGYGAPGGVQRSCITRRPLRRLRTRRRDAPRCVRCGHRARRCPRRPARHARDSRHDRAQHGKALYVIQHNRPAALGAEHLGGARSEQWRFGAAPAFLMPAVRCRPAKGSTAWGPRWSPPSTARRSCCTASIPRLERARRSAQDDHARRRLRGPGFHRGTWPLGTELRMPRCGDRNDAAHDRPAGRRRPPVRVLPLSACIFALPLGGINTPLMRDETHAHPRSCRRCSSRYFLPARHPLRRSHLRKRRAL